MKIKQLMKIILKIDYDSVNNPSKGSFLIYLKKMFKKIIKS